MFHSVQCQQNASHVAMLYVFSFLSNLVSAALHSDKVGEGEAYMQVYHIFSIF